MVDDYAPFATSIGYALSLDYEVRQAGSGAEALRALAEGSFDAVVCDLLMPDLHGLEVQRQAEVLRPGIGQRFIFLTGGADETSDLRARQGCPRLHKPFEMAELQALLGTLFAQG